MVVRTDDVIWIVFCFLLLFGLFTVHIHTRIQLVVVGSRARHNEKGREKEIKKRGKTQSGDKIGSKSG